MDMFTSGTEDTTVTEEYEEELTAAEVLQKLEQAWINEKQAPELLGKYQNTQPSTQPSTHPSAQSNM